MAVIFFCFVVSFVIDYARFYMKEERKIKIDLLGNLILVFVVVVVVSLVTE